MLKFYMNEPFKHEHEQAQAKKLVEILSDKHSNTSTAWLCLNFSFGGVALDAVYITKDSLFVIELKATGKFVSFGANLENSKWTGSNDGVHERAIATPPYVNPYSQAKSYRITVISELDRQRRKFLKRATLNSRDEIEFSKWVKACVLLSQRDASDVKIGPTEMPPKVKKWFCCDTIGAMCRAMEGTLKADCEITSKEIEKLVTEVIGLSQVNHLLEQDIPQSSSGFTPEQSLSKKDDGGKSRIGAFYKRYGSKANIPPIVKEVKKDDVSNELLDGPKDFLEFDLIRTKDTDESIANPIEEGCEIVASKKPLNCGFLRVTIKSEMMMVSDEYSIMELDGSEAVAAVKASCPEIGPFEVSKVLRVVCGISSEKKDIILEYFNQKYASSPQWYRIVYFNGGVNFIFGKPLTVAIPSEKIQQSPAKILTERPMCVDFFQPRWIQKFIDEASEGLPLLTEEEDQTTSNLSYDDIRRHAKAYFARACAEAFVILDWVFGEERSESDISVLDIGCGSGGATVGCLLAIHKHNAYTDDKLAKNCSVQIDGIDVNENAISFAQNIVRLLQKEFPSENIEFNGLKTDLTTCTTHGKKYDIIITSKTIGEVVSIESEKSYLDLLKVCISNLLPGGILIVIDKPCYEGVLQQALIRFKPAGFSGWSKTMKITLDGGRDSEEFVCACLTRQTNNTGE